MNSLIPKIHAEKGDHKKTQRLMLVPWDGSNLLLIEIVRWHSVLDGDA